MRFFKKNIQKKTKFRNFISKLTGIQRQNENWEKSTKKKTRNALDGKRFFKKNN